MPNFTGQALGGVTLVLQDAGFRLGNVSIAPSVTSPQAPSTFPDATPNSVPATLPQPTPASIVVSQNPAPGAKIVVGAAIDLEVR
jgi:beta-lactam-binding protein with PASTA domain